MIIRVVSWCLFIVIIVVTPALQAAYTVSNGKIMNTSQVATLSVQEHYSLCMDAYQNQDWEKLIQQSMIVIKNFSGTPFSLDALFFLGVGYFQTREYEWANQHFTQYLKKQTAPKYFEEAIQYKFKIAEKFHEGAKKHVFGWESLPKWVPARDEAVAIYDEVITALPHHELAAQALFGKAQLLLKDEEYTSSIETYQTLVRRFPKHPLSVEAYIGIGQVYLMQAQDQYPDQDYLDLAEINYRKFRHEFPSEEKLLVAEGMLFEMREIYASHLYEVGRFYERTGKPQASYIYYTRIIAKYPATKVSQLASKRLSHLKYQPESKKKMVEEIHEQIPANPQQKGSSLLDLPVNSGQVVQAEGVLEEQLHVDCQ